MALAHGSACRFVAAGYFLGESPKLKMEHWALPLQIVMFIPEFYFFSDSILS